MSEVHRYPKPVILEQIPLDRHTVIEASAGTGKTYTLEHLIVEIMLHGASTRVSVEQILVVTYTERATSELRSRVRGLLERILHEPPGEVTGPSWRIDESTRRFLESQVFSFDRAPIHTIHGFCRRILSENAFYLRTLFDQSLEDAQTLFNNAFTTALRHELAVDPVLSTYLETWLARYTLEDLRSGLSVISSTPAVLRPRFSPESLSQKLIQLHTNAEAEWANLDRLAPDLGPRDHLELQEIATEILTVARRYAQGIPLLQLLVEADSQIERWQKLRRVSQGCPLLGDMVLEFPPLKPALLQAFLPVIKAAHLAEKRKGFYDFDDMLGTVWERLQHRNDPTTETLIQFLRGRYRYALVDEFQDTDDIQWKIFETIFHQSSENRLFVIGDPKQAIYGFRGADVHTYLEARRTIQKGREPVSLIENFRSTPRVISAYNHIFDQQSKNSFFSGNISYDHEVRPGRPQRRAVTSDDADIIPFQLVRVVPPVKSVNFSEDIHQSYGHFIADEILKILTDEPIFIKDEDGTRQVRASDIYVLARTGAEERKIGEIFRERGVPYAFYRLEGLFRTREAHEILDVLRAIENPYLETNRFKAWITRFFDVSIEDLGRCRNISETHPLFDRLIRWHELAQSRNFERLFMDVLDRSGIIRREIFYNSSERELTNYQHIFELLLEATHGSNMEFKDLLNQLRGWIDGTGKLNEDDRDFQRLESERDAVQIMTFHKSKGLEADVVFLFGGLSHRTFQPFTTLHWKTQRILHIGKPFAQEAIRAAQAEQDEEDRRLLYVGITRARAKVIVPFAFRKKEIYKFTGMMRLLNDRLEAMHRSNALPENFFQIVEIAVRPPSLREPPRILPGRGEIVNITPSSIDIEAIRGKSFVISSYSRMKRATGGYKATSLADLPVIDDSVSTELTSDSAALPKQWRAEDELPGGATQGVFLHQILEDLSYFKEDVDLQTWRESPQVTEVFDSCLARYGIEAKYRPYCETIIYNTLNTPITLPDERVLPRLGFADRFLKEVEFTFPIPEGDWPLDAMPQPDSRFSIERGWIKGFIDLMFEWDGKVYFADWKSDTLDHYGNAILEQHVTNNYGTQASLYGLAVCRMMRLHDPIAFEHRFGGYLYFFLRGIDGLGKGVYARRPEFGDLCAYEETLLKASIR